MMLWASYDRLCTHAELSMYTLAINEGSTDTRIVHDNYFNFVENISNISKQN
jgi:hypothetical protein